MKKLINFFVQSILIIALFSCVFYSIVRIFIFVSSAYDTLDLIPASALLFAELFILIHCFGYLLNTLSVLTSKKVDEAAKKESNHNYPPVAIVVASYNEPLKILEDTLACFYNLTYPNKMLYLLDDTKYNDSQELSDYKSSLETLVSMYKVNLFRRPWRAAKAGIVNDFIQMMNSDLKVNYDLIKNQNIELVKPKYLIIFDADMNPFPDFVEPLVQELELDNKLAFIQTPQYYTNFFENRVAKSSGIQQAVFYEYICEGKNIKDAMFCCGTNVLFRLEALESVGGFDENSVTEDFATSLRLHSTGWKSKYRNTVSAFGKGPEDLGAFFKQQYRWAFGTLNMLPNVIKCFVKNPSAMPITAWWEYFLSSTHYLVGLVFLILSLCPVVFIFFGIPHIMAYPNVYISFYLPYLILTSLVFLFTLQQRKYKFMELNIALFLTPLTFPVYLRAALFAFSGKKEKFTVTPKDGSQSLPLIYLYPQLLLATLCFSAITWGFHRLIYEGLDQPALILNMIWCFYYCFVLSGALHFNYAEEE